MNLSGRARGDALGEQYTYVTTIASVWNADPVSSAAEGKTPSVTHAARNGWKDAFAQCADGVYRFILVRVGGDRHAADDILQECCRCAAAHKNPPATDDALAPWLMGIARNLIRRHWRHQRRAARTRPLEDPSIARRLLQKLESMEGPPDAVLAEEEATQLMLAVTALPADEQRLIFAFYFEGRSLAQLGAYEDASAKAIESRLYRARRRLRNALMGNGRAGEP